MDEQHHRALAEGHVVDPHTIVVGVGVVDQVVQLVDVDLRRRRDDRAQPEQQHRC